MFKNYIKKNVIDISANQTLNIVRVCLIFAIYDVQLPDIYLANFLYNFKNLTYHGF